MFENIVSECGKYTIRPIQPEDNKAVAEIGITTLAEFGCVGPGYASSDPELQSMYETYQAVVGEYFVIVENETQKVMGGGGFSRLKNSSDEEALCELQKLYFVPALRGKGLAKKLLRLCIERAATLGFRRMYLESVPAMTAAISLYEKNGFQHLSGPMGNTGHTSCGIFMLRELPVLASL
jgi:putative acetyltransferase